MNTRFIAYALFCTHMINGMDESPATTTRKLEKELAAIAALVRSGDGSLKQDEAQALIMQLREIRVSRTPQISRTSQKKRDKSRSPIMSSQGLRGHASLPARRVFGLN